MAGEIPSGEQSVFHFLDIFALGFGLEACSAAVHRQWGLAFVCVVGSVGFHLLGTKWATIQTQLSPRLRSGIQIVTSNHRYRIVARIAAVLLVGGDFATRGDLYLYDWRVKSVVGPAPPSINWPHIPPPKGMDYPVLSKPKLRPIAHHPIVRPRLTEDEISRGMEPEGAPNLGGSNTKWLDEQKRLNSMSLGELRSYLADTIAKLMKFDTVTW